MSHPQLLMRRSDVDDPPVALPPFAIVRTAGRDDAPVLAALLHRAFPEKEWTLEKTMGAFFDDPTVRATFVAQRQSGGPLLATASARIDPMNFPDDGYLHWVGADPDARGLGLGRAVSLAAMRHLRGLGLGRIVLETDDHRLPAIHLYRSLGFAPVPWHETHPARWERIERALAATPRRQAQGDPGIHHP